MDPGDRVGLARESVEARREGKGKEGKGKEGKG